MNSINSFEDDKIMTFLKEGTAFDGYLYSMGILLDEFVKNGMHNCMIEPFDIRKINIFKLSSFELANILISCVLTSSLDVKNVFLQKNLENLENKYKN